MKTKSLATKFTLILLVLLLIGCRNLPARGMDATGDELLLDTLDVQSRVEAYDDYQFAVHFPITPSPKVNVAVKAAVEGRIQAFEETVDEAQPIREDFKPYNLTLDFVIDHLAADFIAFSLWEMGDVGGANPRQELMTFNADLEKEALLALSDLFQPGSNYLARLSDLAAQALAENQEVMQLSDPQWIAQGTAPDEEHFRHFLLTDNGLVIYFDKYQVAAGAAGITQVTLPYQALSDLLQRDALPESILVNLPHQPQGKPAGSQGGHGEDEKHAGNANGAEMNSDQDITDQNDGQAVDGGEEKPAAGGETLPAGGAIDSQGALAFAGGEKPAGKRIALTFDDGPHKAVTPFILDELLERQAKATFFVLGNRVAFHPEIMERMVAEGHEIGNHSWNHARLTGLSADELRAQIEDTQASILATAGVEPTMMRPPYGAIDEEVAAAAQMPLVLWSVDTRDWEYRNHQRIVEAALRDAHDGAIILLHDLYPTTAAAVGEIVDQLQQRGYELVTVSELLGLDQHGNWSEYAGQTIRYLQ